jgi:diguanylate cyclase (GGDEF)-like protein/PAS domain S-box-containing protein
VARRQRCVRGPARLGRLVNFGQTGVSSSAAPSRPSDEVVLTRAVASLLLTSVAMAAVWLALPSLGHVDKRGMAVVAVVAALFAAALLTAAGRIGARGLLSVLLISTTVVGGYMYFGGDTAVPFGVLNVVAAAAAVWFLSRSEALVQVVWMAASYGLALWLAGSGQANWPEISGRDFGILLLGVVALGAVSLLITTFKRRIVEDDERLAAIVEFSQDAIVGKDPGGAINVWNPGAERLYGYEASEVIGQPVSMLVPPAHLGEELVILERVLAGGQVENYETERLCKDGSLVTVSLSVSPIRDMAGRVIGASSIARDVTEAMRAQETIRHQALYDELTGLPNRTLFLDRVTNALARNERLDQTVAVFLIDLDRFKLVNDSLGHDIGDQLLQLVAGRLTDAVRHGDTLARLGGDEFAMLSERLPAEATATRVANRLMSALEAPVVLDGDHRVGSASIGIALSDSRRASTAPELVRDAEAAMYSAKAAGRDRIALFDEPMRARVLDRVRTESALRAALTHNHEIHVHYQPLVSLRTGRIVGAEALARWRHPEWGAVPPLEFVPVAEDSGLIHRLGAHIIRRAARECAAWQQEPDFAGVAINVSIRQLVKPEELVRLVRRVIAAEGIGPGFLTLEVTESLVIEQLDAARKVLDSLRELGVHLSLDDFGTGYSSLSYLSNLPFDSVKIDRSLIHSIVDTPQAAAVAAAIIQMGHALNLRVIGEGIETAEQATRLQLLGCDIGQGFYFARPMPAEEFAALLHGGPNLMPGSPTRPRSDQARGVAPVPARRPTPHASNPKRAAVRRTP